MVILETRTEKSIIVMDTNYTHSHLYTFLPFPSTWGNNLQCGRFLKQRPDFISQEVNVKHKSGSVRCHQLRPNNLPSILMLNSPRRRLFFPLGWTIDLLECLYLTSNAVNVSSAYSLNGNGSNRTYSCNRLSKNKVEISFHFSLPRPCLACSITCIN